jgi:hypothetical protein
MNKGTVPSVYLDANVWKFSATELRRLHPRTEKVNWGGKEHEIEVHDFVTVNPNDAISNNPELKREADLLPQVASLGTKGIVNFVTQMETDLETWGLPKLDSQSGSFYGASVTMVPAPVEYGRVILGGGIDLKAEQFRFLTSISDKRFLELQRMTGAYQGPGKINPNQLLDAWHIWCAEHNKCEFFLTLDFTLQKVTTNSPHSINVRIVRPSELLLTTQQSA